MAKYTYPNIPDTLIALAPSPDLKLCICIPCYQEEDIGSTISSLMNCVAIQGDVELIILINDSEEDNDQTKQQNLISYETCVSLRYSCAENGLSLIPILVDEIIVKKAGVGYARRLAMDEAARRFNVINSSRGIIACLDADTTVSENYLMEIVRFFEENQNLSACSIAFEHDLRSPDEKINSAICDYESHLRYFINMQRLIGLPFAYQTVGSAMAVTSRAYQKLGGMNSRKAGEDFYFLHKFIKNGLVGDLNSACVYPSARVSDRVPFGTGKAVGDILSSRGSYETYNSQSFEDIHKLIVSLPLIFENDQGCFHILAQLSEPLTTYLKKENFQEKIAEIRSNTSNYRSFRKRFFHWYDAFRLMKCLHFLRDMAYANIEVSIAIELLFSKLDLVISSDKYKNLHTLRAYDKDKIFKVT